MEIYNTNVSESTYIYEITQSKEYIDGKGITDVYGISIYNCNKELAQIDGEYCRIDGISTDYNQIRQLKELIEEIKLFPVHLHNVVEDFFNR